MKPPEPDKHPTTSVGAAHRFNKITGTYAAQKNGDKRVRLDVDVAFTNVLADAYQAWKDAAGPYDGFNHDPAHGGDAA